MYGSEFGLQVRQRGNQDRGQRWVRLAWHARCGEL